MNKTVSQLISPKYFFQKAYLDLTFTKEKFLEHLEKSWENI